MAGVFARAFPGVPDKWQLADALAADLTDAPFGDLYSSARYRVDVAPIVSQRAAERMSLRATVA
jgi:hypothetical protein